MNRPSMSWNNVKLIFLREVRDQLRDRRTIFMIAVLPLFFYPLLGMALFQATHFLQSSPSRVLVVGYQPIDDVPGLIEEGRFSPEFVDGGEADLLQLELINLPPAMEEAGEEREKLAGWKRRVSSGEVQAVVYFPPGFDARMQEYRAAVRRRFERPDEADLPLPELPHPMFVYDSGQEKSSLAQHRVSRVLNQWAGAIGRQNLRESRIPESVASPKAYESSDLAQGTSRVDARVWAKILPFVLVIWAVTGAFYPAVDLCAGEKERGTLETLLSSPADRGEIVFGKLFTVMLFSMATAVLNLLSMGITGALVLQQLRHFQELTGASGVSLPHYSVAIWLLVALVPVSAFFSAVCLALASFARSTKEGQYYLMPVILITMPLIVIPMAPTAELTLGNSLIPVTGIVLMLRALIEGTFAASWQLAIPVAVSTAAYCYLAIRWAVDQFNSEKVLFRAADRWSLGLWLRHLLRDRQPTPTVAMAAMCGLVILTLRFFFSFAAPQNLAEMTFVDLAKLMAVTQLVVILTPALMMTVMLTRSLRQTLQLDLPHWGAVPLAMLLAVAVHPLVISLHFVVKTLYPTGELSEMNRRMMELFSQAPNIWWVLLVIAVLPAVCEEIAFRGFILSGLRHLGHKWRAIGLSALFFGVSHGILQQSMMATVVGCLIGYLVVQSGSLWTGVAYHMVHNAFVYLVGTLSAESLEHLMWEIGGEPATYSPPILLASLLLTGGLLAWFHHLPYRKSREETLQESIDHEPVQALVP